MTRRLTLALLGALLTSGCLFKGKPKPPPPVETVETTQRRADSLWAAAVDHHRHGRWGKVTAALERALLIMSYDDPRRGRGHFMMGEALFSQQNQLQAIREFRRVADEDVYAALAPEALLRAGDAYASLWTKPDLDPSYGESALSAYRELVDRFPNTTAARRATVRLQRLQEMFAAKEFRAAMFYYRIKAYDSAILGFRSTVANYPRTSIVPEALYRLVRAYHTVNYAEDLKDTCLYIQRFYPATMERIPREVCPAPDAGLP